MLPPSWAGLAACPWGPVDPLPTHLEGWETGRPKRCEQVLGDVILH